MKKAPANVLPHQLKISRLINAPRQLIFNAFTLPEHLDRWWGPAGFVTQTEQLRFKSGQHWVYAMTGPDGHLYPNYMTYLEIIAPSYIRFSLGESAENPDMFEAEIFLEDQGAQTLVTLLQHHKSAEMKDMLVKQAGAEKGGNESLEKLDRLVQDQIAAYDFTYERTLNAPRELVFEVFSNPSHLAKWWGPAGLTLKHTNGVIEDGGHFHYGMETPDGNLMWGILLFNKIVKPEFIGFSSGFSNAEAEVVAAPFAPDFPKLLHNEWYLIELEGKTLVRAHAKMDQSATAEQRTFFHSMSANVKQGNDGMFANLETYLESL